MSTTEKEIPTAKAATTVAPSSVAPKVEAAAAAPKVVAQTTTAPTKVATKRAAKKPVTVAKVAVKEVAKPIATAKPVAKPVTKPVSKSAAKATAKTVAKVIAKSAAKPKIEKPVKLKKPKLVRDSFTIPKAEYTVLDDLKQRAGKLASSVKKSELLRAGVKALAAMSDMAFLASLKAVPAIKTGRPSKN